MKIVHIQHAMPSSGNAAYRLHQAMRQAGLESWMLTLTASAPKDYAVAVPTSVPRRLTQGINAAWRKYRKHGLKDEAYFYSHLPLLGNGIANHPLVLSADALYLHWIAGGSTALSDIEALAQTGKPVFIYLHDMWPFTGGCHHSLACNGYQNTCRSCPMFHMQKTGVSRQLQQKARVYARYPNIRFIAPGRWIQERAERALPLRGKRIHRIPNIVDEQVFKPLDKHTARALLNLPPDKPLITFGCAGGAKSMYYKGWTYLCDALRRIHHEGLEVVLYGSGYDDEMRSTIPYPVHFLGRLTDETTVSRVCNASNLYVAPSLCENYSLSIIENLAVGTPVVAFDHTGSSDLVTTGRTGYLARYKDVDDLAAGMELLLQHPLTVTGWSHPTAQAIVQEHMTLLNHALSR